MTSVNRAQFDNWNGEGGQRWAADAERRDRVLAAVGDVLLDVARPQLREAVLDIGCGCGAISLAAAQAVGPDGHVLGADISTVMLDIARGRARAGGLPNVTFTAADVQTHRFEAAAHDLAISRFGTMFFDDLRAAFSNIAGALRPGGRLCIATWQPLADNDWLALPGAALLRYGTMPDELTVGPGMFAQSDPAAVTADLQAAGFVDVHIRSVRVPQLLGATPDDALDYLAGTGVARTVLATIPETDVTSALMDVRTVLSEHIGPQGVTLDGGILITTAVVG